MRNAFNRITFRLSAEERGFTLIELLVVILIIGILAAIVIPSFLNQKGKATDASAKELAHTAQVAAESYGTDHNGSYTGMTPTILQTYESTIQTSAGNNNAWLSAATPTATGLGYTVTATAPTTADTFSIIRGDTGTITRQCKTVAASSSGCTAASGSTASW